MALLYSESWRPYTATADIAKRWSVNGSAWTWNSTGGPDGGPYMSCAAGASGASSYIYPTYTGNINKNSGLGIFGMWVKLSAKPSSTVAVQSWLINNVSPDTTRWFKATTGSGIITITGYNNGSATGLTNICDNKWHFVEYRFQISNTNSAFTLYLDGAAGAEIPTGNSLNFFVGSTCNGPLFIGNNAGMNVSIGPNFFYHDSGDAPVSSSFPMGPQIISCLSPTGDSSVQFTPDSGATNYTQVDEQPPDDDTSYVEDGTSGHQDLYDYGNLSFTPASIAGVLVTGRVKNPGTAAINFQQQCKNNATTTSGTSTAATIANYVTYQQGFMKDPNTAAAWTKSGLDSALFGIKVP